ncbi:flagellar biosynthesis protein [Roseovarius sp. CAU 1744]|uniref:flagellar biosynthesis protein n=1 Tax=Roseovarius sp. CAU 1744 TaxID=3140368 RepID=UPI00325C1DCA
MSISHLLEDYSDFKPGSPVALTDVSLEEQRLEAFESGYQAGWDDCVKAQSKNSTHVSADLSQSLRELSFTYQEAYAGILESLEPLLRGMVDAVLPHAAQATLGSRISEMLFELAKEHGQQPVQIVTAPSNSAAVEELLSSDLPLPVTVENEPSLGDGQVTLRIGNAEREINLSEVLAEIDRAVTGFFEENEKDVA